MRWIGKGQRGGWASAAACLVGLACGGSSSDELFEPTPTLPEPVVTPEPVVDEMDGDPQPMMPAQPGEGSVPPPSSEPEPEAEVGCRPALGVSGAPQTISEAIILLNTLPKPVTLACFLEALDRPLSLYMTQSNDSLQPSPGARSPRTFIVNGALAMSIVLDGAARETLEFGFRPEPGRSIKAEIEFPLTRDVSESSLFERVQVTETTTACGACHVGEALEEFPGFPNGVFVSDVLVPFDLDEVSIESMQAETDACDPAVESFRCGLLSALFERGDVVRGVLPSPE